MPKFLNLIQYVDDGVRWTAETNPNNNESGFRTVKLSRSNAPGTTVMRDENGRAQISDPVDNLDIVNKKYDDDKWDKFNLKNGTGTGSIQQRGITYNKLITDYEPNMVAYVSYIGAGVSSPTSEQLIALLNSDKTNPYVAQILGNYTFEQYCVGFLAGTGAIQSGVSNKTAIDSLIAGALARYGLTSSSDLSNIIGKAGSSAAILGAMNKAFSPGAFAGGVGCEAGDEGYPGDSICSFAYGSNVKTKGICSVGVGRDLENLGDTSAVFGRGNKEYKIEGNEGEKYTQRIYLDNLAEAGGTVTGTGDDRVGVTGINKGTNNFMAGNSHYIGDDAYNNTVLGNQNIIGKVDADGNCANNLISGLNNYIGQSNGCGIIGYDNKIRNSVNIILLGNGLEAQDTFCAVGVGWFNAINSKARFFVGNGTSDSDRKNAFEVLADGRAKVQSAPVDNDDVVRKADLANAAYWVEVGRFTARQSGAGNKYDFIALKNAGYKYARVRENRTGGYCGADIDLSKVTTSTQIKLIDKAAFWSSTRIDIISITQHAADVTTADFIFYKLSITISGTSASYELKTSGETETLIVEARK